MEALYFGIPDNILSYLTDNMEGMRCRSFCGVKVNQIEMDLTYYPSINEYQGRRTLQIVIKNFAGKDNKGYEIQLRKER